MGEAGAAGDGRVDGIRRGDEPERPVARRRPLGRHEDVRPDAPVIEREPAPGSPEAGHDLVGDEQHAVPAADVGDGRPVAVGRDDRGQRRADDRLGDERGHGARARRLEGPVELGGEIVGAPEGVGARQARPIRVGRRDVPEPAEPALVWPAQGLAAGQVQRAERVAVIAPPPRVDDQALRLAAREVVGAGQLERRLDRLGAAGHRIDRRVVDREVDGDLARVRLERLGREGAAVGVREPTRLVGHGGGDLAAAVTDVDDDRAAGGVEVLASVGGQDRRAVGLDRDRRVGEARATEDAPGGHPAIVPDELVGSDRGCRVDRPRGPIDQAAREPGRSRWCTGYGCARRPPPGRR